jgi:hypothetical protein
MRTQAQDNDFRAYEAKPLDPAVLADRWCEGHGRYLSGFRRPLVVAIEVTLPISMMGRFMRN